MGISGSGVRGHDQYHIAEIDLPSLVVRYDSIVHDLEEKVVYVFVCLLDLVKEQHAVWILPYGFGQDASVVISDIAGRGADQLCYRVLL